MVVGFAVFWTNIKDVNIILVLIGTKTINPLDERQYGYETNIMLSYILL